MSKSRKAKKPGPLPHQRRLRSARELHRFEILARSTVAASESIKASMAALPVALDALGAVLSGSSQGPDWRLP